MGTVELQIFVSLIVVLCAAFVALICDFLKGRNEQLREQNIELKARQEERQRYLELHRAVQAEALAAIAELRDLAKTTVRAAQGEAPKEEKAEPEAVPPEATGLFPLTQGNPVYVPRGQARMEAGPLGMDVQRSFSGDVPFLWQPKEELLPVQLEWQKPPEESRELPAPLLEEIGAAVLPPMPNLDEQPISEPEPVADAIRIRVIDEDAVLPESQSLFSQTEKAEEPEPPMAVRIAWTPEIPRPQSSPSVPMRFSSIAAMFARTEPTAPGAAIELLPPEDVTTEEPVKGSAKGVVVEMPAPDAAVLSAFEKQFKSSEPFEGLVATVSLLEFHELLEKLGQPAMDELMGSVEGALKSLQDDADLLSRTGEDEYALLFPGLTESKAQRRLTLLSERLWDLQLRLLGTASVFFSWGAVEGQREPVAALLKASREQMLDLRRTRRNAMQFAPTARRRTVNG